jgi:hypothetical protein
VISLALAVSGAASEGVPLTMEACSFGFEDSFYGPPRRKREAWE